MKRQAGLTLIEYLVLIGGLTTIAVGLWFFGPRGYAPTPWIF